MFFKSNVLSEALKAVIASLIFTVVSALIFAVICSVFSLPTLVVKPVNYLIKCMAVFLGCFLAIGQEKGALKGVIYGALIMLICHLVFSTLSCNFEMGLSFLWDLLLGCAVGGISGIVKVNRRAN